MGEALLRAQAKAFRTRADKAFAELMEFNLTQFALSAKCKKAYLCNQVAGWRDVEAGVEVVVASRGRSVEVICAGVVVGVVESSCSNDLVETLDGVFGGLCMGQVTEVSPLGVFEVVLKTNGAREEK